MIGYDDFNKIDFANKTNLIVELSTCAQGWKRKERRGAWVRPRIDAVCTPAVRAHSVSLTRRVVEGWPLCNTRPVPQRGGYRDSRAQLKYLNNL